MTPSINTTVPTAIKYDPPAEKWGKVVRCEDCRWWQRFGFLDGHDNAYGLCTGLSKNYQPCYLEAFDSSDAWGDSNDEININTREDFGCVLGEPKP